MRTFEGFNSSNGEVCPLCKTSDNIETVLVPIPGTEDGNLVQTMQFHKKCVDHIGYWWVQESHSYSMLAVSKDCLDETN